MPARTAAFYPDVRIFSASHAFEGALPDRMDDIKFWANYYDPAGPPTNG